MTELRNIFIVFRAERVLLISHEIAAAVRRLRVPEHRLVTCRVVGIDIERFARSSDVRDAARNDLGIRPEDVVVTTIGFLGPRKRHDLFVRAAAQVPDPVDGRHLIFLIAGNGPDRAQLEALVSRLGQQSRVRLLGQRLDVDTLLAATDIYVKPGILEGFIGITVLEAMASRRPVIAFATKDVEAAITDGDTGIIVPSGDVSALAAAVRRLVEDPDEAQRLAERGHARVRERFSLGSVVDELESLYARLTADTRR